jgi:hypothetical protein
METHRGGFAGKVRVPSEKRLTRWLAGSSCPLMADHEQEPDGSEHCAGPLWGPPDP